MRAAVVHGYKEPLSIEEAPEPGEALVRAEAAGLRRTDIHAAHGDWPVKPKLGTRADLKEVFDLHADRRTKVIFEKRCLDAVNERFEEVEKGGVDARLVFDFGEETEARHAPGATVSESSEQQTGEVGESRGPIPG
jgi:D-arabinose 1-dehydrogenase-like Zn-dependent alcohol dehydrogenase